MATKQKGKVARSLLMINASLTFPLLGCFCQFWKDETHIYKDSLFKNPYYFFILFFSSKLLWLHETGMMSKLKISVREKDSQRHTRSHMTAGLSSVWDCVFLMFWILRKDFLSVMTMMNHCLVVHFARLSIQTSHSNHSSVRRLQPHGGHLWYPGGGEKSHFILSFPWKDTLYWSVQTSDILQPPVSYHGDNVVTCGLLFPMLMWEELSVSDLKTTYSLLLGI